MKRFSDISAAIATREAQLAEAALNEETVHLIPHGDKGTHFKVHKGIPGHLEKGEIIHDSHVDDLHDMGIKVKIHQNLKEAMELDEARSLRTAAMNGMGTFTKADALRSHRDVDYYHPSTGNKHTGTITHIGSTGYHVQDEDTGETHKFKFYNKQKHASMLDESAPDFNAPERTREEEIKIAKGQLHGDYKGHQAAMKKKHNLSEDNLEEISRETLGRYIKVAQSDREHKEQTGRSFSDIGHDWKADGEHEKAADSFRKAGDKFWRADKRKAGINKAVDKLVKS